MFSQSKNLIVAIACLWNLVHCPESTLAQTSGSIRPTITFQNESQQDFLVNWLPENGAARLIGKLEPGKELAQLTTLGHRFQLKAEDFSMVFSAIQRNQTIVLEKEYSRIELHGWSIMLNHRLWTLEPEKTQTMLQLMSVQLTRIIEVVPQEALGHLRAVTIWVNPKYDNVRPTAEYHGAAGWLKANGRRQEMAKCVEVTNVSNFEFENTRMPYVMLHELAHAYHDQVLGFRNVKIRKAFERAEASGVYDSVKRFTGRRIVQDKAYALSNHKEYFAESTEAFFGKNDFFPFDRKELKANDPEMYELLFELWGVER